MATGWVRARFLYTQARPTGQDPQPRPDPIINRIFFPGPRPAPPGPVGPCHFRAYSVAQSKKKKKICLPDTNFLSNQIVGETQENPDLYKSETLCPIKKIPKSEQIPLSK